MAVVEQSDGEKDDRPASVAASREKVDRIVDPVVSRGSSRPKSNLDTPLASRPATRGRTPGVPADVNEELRRAMRRSQVLELENARLLEELAALRAEKVRAEEALRAEAADLRERILDLEAE